jgi:hypothetical protein
LSVSATSGRRAVVISGIYVKLAMTLAGTGRSATAAPAKIHFERITIS